MTLTEFLKNSNTAFVKPTQRLNGLNFRTAEGKLTATILMENPPETEGDILTWVKEHLEWNVTTQEDNSIIRVSKPRVIDYGMSLDSLFNTPVKSKAKA